MKKIKLLLIFSISFFFSKGYGQFFQTEYYSTHHLYFEAGGGVGIMNCITDLGGANGTAKYYLNEIKSKNFALSPTVFAGITYQDIIGARLQGTWGKIQSADGDITGKAVVDDYKRNRNLSFRSKITEIALLFEFRPLILFDLEPKKWAPEPYLNAGVGWFHFNPQTQYKGQWVDLKPLHTEGEGFPEYPGVSNYSLSQVNIPMGIGLRYKLSPRFNIRLEYLHRMLFTDYLDDASSPKFINPATFDKNLSPASAAAAKALYDRNLNGRVPPRRGNPKDNDTYMSLSIKLGIALGNKERP